MSVHTDFSKLLRRCIVDEFEELLGESPTKSLFFHLKLDQHIENPREFHRRLEKGLSRGAVVLEKNIVKELFRRLNIDYEQKGSFEQYVEYARKIYARRIGSLGQDGQNQPVFYRTRTCFDQPST
jgi:hypothetical protein